MSDLKLLPNLITVGLTERDENTTVYLNTAQRSVVTVLGLPGTGKTTTLATMLGRTMAATPSTGERRGCRSFSAEPSKGLDDVSETCKTTTLASIVKDQATPSTGSFSIICSIQFPQIYTKQKNVHFLQKLGSPFS